MITKIGIVAGEIWHYLDEHNRECMFSEIVANSERSRDNLLMSIGWLAREGHVRLEEKDGDHKVTLRQ